MKSKPIRLYFRVAMMLLMLLTTMTAWATDETKVFTISHAVGDPNNDYCGTITYDGHDFLIPDANIMQNQCSEGRITMRSKMYNSGNAGTVKLYPHISGKVKSLTFSSAKFMFDTSVASTEHYVKIGKGDIWTNSYTEDMSMSTASTMTFTFTNDDGLQLANENEYIEIKMRDSEPTRNASFQISGTLTITYEPTASTLTHTHNFSYNVAGNTLTATCAHDDGKECNLASSSYQISTSLMPPQNLIYHDGWYYPASMSGFENFRAETGATIGSITYIKTDTNEDYGTSEPNATGTYTASVTITARGTGYTLQTSYRVTDYHFVYNNYPQFTTDKEGNYAGNGQTVTITFTPKFGETLTGLTVTGATTNYSLGSGITDNGSNTYTFTMPGEDVTIGATFSISEDDFAETGTNEYTIKTANGWGWFCFTVSYDLAPDGFSGKTVKLGTSVGSSEMAGTSGHPFKGTFDGQGNTLTFNLQASEGHSAPFHYTDGATISNLHVGGTITGGDHTSLGGLVGYAVGNITIENCHVSTQISTTHSGAGFHGGIIAFWYDSNVECTITGCVYDGLIYNSSEANATTYCSGFIGNLFGSNLTVTFTDCLYAPVAYGTGKNTLGDECHTFVYPNSSPTYNMTNCYYTSILGNRQGRPAATATTAPANLGNATTDHGMVDGYANGFLYNGNYYTPKYGDAVVEYRFNDWNERADVTINGTGENLVGVNITETVGNIKSVTYNRPFTAAQAATVILPFNYTCNGNEGGKFYSFAGISDIIPIMEDGNQVTSLTANTPYVFMPTTSTMSFPNITSMTGGVTTLQPTAGDHEVTSDDGNWTLIGTYNVITWQDCNDESSYYLDGFILHLYIDKKILPTDCYLLGPEEINYYLVGTMTDWAIDSDYQLQPNTEAEGEYYILNVPLAKGTGIKAVSSEDNSTIKTWFPGGTGNDYIITSNGIYDIYFRPDGNSGWGYYYLYVAKQDVNSADVYFAKEGYATYYNGVFDVTLPDDVIARIVTDSGERLTYQTIAEGNGTVPAGTAVMLYSQAVKTTGTAASRTLTFCDENSAAPVTATNLLHGSDEATRTTGEGKHYKLSYNLQGTDIGWYWGAADGAPFQSGAHKAWLVLSGTSAPSFLGLDGETTKITTTNLTNLTNSDAWFTLNGLKLDKAPSAKGAYIHNGHKVVIK